MEADLEQAVILPLDPLRATRSSGLGEPMISELATERSLHPHCS